MGGERRDDEGWNHQVEAWSVGITSGDWCLVLLRQGLAYRKSLPHSVG